MSDKEDMMSESGDDVDSVSDDFKTFSMLVPIIKGTLQEYSVSGTIRIGAEKDCDEREGKEISRTEYPRYGTLEPLAEEISNIKSDNCDMTG
jgi:hypothetical protein